MNLFELHDNFINDHPLISLSYYCFVWFIFKDMWFLSLDNIKDQELGSKGILSLMWLGMIIICFFSVFKKENLNLSIFSSLYFLITIIFWIELSYRKIKNIIKRLQMR